MPMLFALLALGSSLVRPKVEPKRKVYTVGDSSEMCIFCKFYVSMVEDYLEEGETEEEIIEALDGLCEYVIPSLASVCETAVTTLVPTVISLIEQEFPPNVICQKIGLCTD